MSLLQKADSLKSASPVEFGPAWKPTVRESAGSIPHSKRILDIAGALLAIVFFLPLMILIYVGLLLSGGNPIFIQHRVGRNGVLFHCYKFRSMVKDANRVLS